MTTSDIRQKFLEFFKEKGHTIVESDLLVPKNDPTLLFTGAGMNQFKEQFMGKNVTYTRATTCQKCIRTGDLENVGKTPRHHTFFEMLGNFSFGDYFKKEAIQWAWEFMTDRMKIPQERLWISVYEDDDEAYDIWLNEVKIPVERMVRLGAHDNFWPQDAPTLGPNGPCGPCSEIFYDWGEDRGCGRDTCSPACDCGRFVEVWNLVFTQFERKPNGDLDPLPNKNIDTGMGLERMASVVQDVKTNFEIDIFVPITQKIKEAVGDLAAPDLNLIADHLRAVTFAIADGVSPSNEKRGYVVRKLIRRAWLKGRSGHEVFLFNLVPVVAKLFKNVYPELEEKREHIAAIVEEEEKRFRDTLESAMPVLDGMLEEGPRTLSGENVFKLVDTYGMPVEIITDICQEKGVKTDLARFDILMEERKEQSRKGSDMESEFIFRPDQFTNAPKPEYLDGLPLEAKVVFIVADDKETEVSSEGDNIELVSSPQSSSFYAESGGQVGDTGSIVGSTGEGKIIHTIESDGRKIFQVHVRKGSIKKGDIIKIELDDDKKAMTAKNHTATHLLQSALREVLGDQVKQSGSLVDSRHLRFDFTQMKKLSEREIMKVEDIVNGWISDKIDVCKEEKTLEAAKEEGALSFFGEKYGKTVRVVTVGDRSKELCGGTHIDNTSEIGLFKVTSETAVASGIRRIEAVTGEAAGEWIKDSLKRLMEDVKERGGFASGPEEEEILSAAQNVIDGRIEIDRDVIKDFDNRLQPGLLGIKEKLEKRAKRAEKEKQAGALNDIKVQMDDAAENPQDIGGVSFVSCVFPDAGMQVLKKAVTYIGKKAPTSVVILGGNDQGKAFLLSAVPSEVVSKGISAKDIVCSVAKHINGSGGGKDTFAQAGGSLPEGLDEAVSEAKKFIEKKGKS